MEKTYEARLFGTDFISADGTGNDWYLCSFSVRELWHTSRLRRLTFVVTDKKPANESNWHRLLYRPNDDRFYVTTGPNRARMIMGRATKQLLSDFGWSQSDNKRAFLWVCCYSR